MYILYGTKGDRLFVRNESVTLHTFRSKWFSGETEDIVTTLPYSAMVDVKYTEPTWLTRGYITFKLRNVDLPYHVYSMGVKLRNKKRIESLYEIIKGKIS